MSIEEINDLKVRFFNSDDLDVKKEATRKALNLAGFLLRKEVGWAINYDALGVLVDAGKISLPKKFDEIHLEETFLQIEAMPDDMKRLILARLLTALVPNSLVMELGLALGEAVDGKEPALLKSTTGKHLGTIELWTYRGMATAYVAYLTALGNPSGAAIQMVADAFEESFQTVDGWSRRDKRPREIDNAQIDIWVKEARMEGKQYKELRTTNQNADSELYGSERLKETGYHYQIVNKRIAKQKRKKGK